MKKLISIIVPAYNAERYLSECIHSIIGQSYTNWELILVDDGSTDSTYQICLDYAVTDRRIRTFHNENHGVSYTRNFGIDVATGEYVCFIDADDRIESDYIETLYNEIVRTEADVIFCGYRLLYEDNMVDKSPRIKAGHYQFADISNKAIDDGTLSGILFGSVCSALYRYDIIKDRNIRFDSLVRRNEDGLFNLQLLPFAKRIVVCDYLGYAYRQWKTDVKKQGEVTPSNELNRVSDIIKERFGFYDSIDTQLKRREISIIFWNSQRIANADLPIRKVTDRLKRYISGTEFYDWYYELDFSSLNRYKKILIALLHKKQYLLFAMLIRNIKPILERRLKH